MSIVLVGSTSGSITLQEPAVAGSNTISLPAATGTMALLQTPSFATTIGVGNATPSTSGAGITFPATQSASSDANTLDDYEEGTWSPTATGFSTGTGWSGTYTKIGRMVYLTIVNSTPITATKLTSFFTGLPFLPAQVSSLSLTSDTNVNALGQNLVDAGGTNGRIFVQTFSSSGTPYVSATYITAT